MQLIQRGKDSHSEKERKFGLEEVDMGAIELGDLLSK